MHHVYTRRIVIALVLFFAVLAIIFGPLVITLRAVPGTTAALPPGEETANTLPETNESQETEDNQEAGPPTTTVTLPDGQAAFDNLCASCHKAQSFADKISKSLDSDATSLAQLEKLIGPPAHGGASPAEALAIVIQLRNMAGLSSEYPPGVPTPPAAATAAAAEPTLTTMPPDAVMATTDYEAVWNQICADCHRAERFVAGLSAESDPDLRTQQAVEYLSGPPPHYNRPVSTFLPAMNYIRELSGLEPMP